MSSFADKHTIVLDVGSRYVKCGVSEERAPRCVVRWEVHELLKARADLSALRAYLAEQLHTICFNLMHVNPRHRRFLVCEDVIGPRSLREALVDVLFVDLKAVSVTLVPSALSAVYATSHHTALVVDCGFYETKVLPVYKGIPLLHCFASVQVGSASCCDQILELIGKSDSPHSLVGGDYAEEVLERACFVQPLQNRIMDVADANLHLQARQPVQIPASVRGGACEHLFAESDEVGASIVSCITDLLARLPLDVRAAMMENVLVSGGTSMVPGFCKRLEEELVAHFSAAKQRLSERVTILRPLFPRNVLAWVGASIFAAIDSSKDSMISATEYASSGSRCLPDWTSIAETEI